MLAINRTSFNQATSRPCGQKARQCLLTNQIHLIQLFRDTRKSWTTLVLMMPHHSTQPLLRLLWTVPNCPSKECHNQDPSLWIFLVEILVGSIPLTMATSCMVRASLHSYSKACHLRGQGLFHQAHSSIQLLQCKVQC